MWLTQQNKMWEIKFESLARKSILGLPFHHSSVTYVFPYLSVSVIKAHLLLFCLQASLPNSPLDTAQMLLHKLLKSCRQKAKQRGMFLGWASLLSQQPLSPDTEREVTVFALANIFHCSLPVPHSTWPLHCSLFSQEHFLLEYAGTESVASDCLLLIERRNSWAA